MSDRDIKSKPIYDGSGKLVGSIIGRREEIERFNPQDLAKQIKSDEQKHREHLRNGK